MLRFMLGRGTARDSGSCRDDGRGGRVADAAHRNDQVDNYLFLSRSFAESFVGFVLRLESDGSACCLIDKTRWSPDFPDTPAVAAS